MGKSEQKYEGPMGPVFASIIMVIGWLVFILLYALYWSKGFDLFQNIIVTIVSLAIAGLLIGAMWLIWYHPTGELRRKQKTEQQREEEGIPKEAAGQS